MEMISAYIQSFQEALDGLDAVLKPVSDFLSMMSGFLWGQPYLPLLILGIGLFLTVGLGFRTIYRIPLAFKMLFKGTRSRGEGHITPFAALMTSLSATVGTGNIAGVATAIMLGGPGAIFWMWMTAFAGMATKYAEAALAVRYREKDDRGNFVGGPMYYIRNGLGPRFAWLALLFALFAGLAGFGIGNMVQAHEVAGALHRAFDLPTWLSGVIMMLLVGAVLLGGLKSISRVATTLIPLMALVYILACGAVLIIFADKIPYAFGLIFEKAFSLQAAAGGAAGAAIWYAIQAGVARGVFSNEAGLGSAPIAHAAAQTRGPASQGIVAMLGTFIDTIIICTFTALAILVTDAWVGVANGSMGGAVLTSNAFAAAFPSLGAGIVAVALSIFAFTTILGWSYYSERALQYLLGTWIIWPFRIFWTLAVLIGANLKFGFVWVLADVLNAMMALPNLIALVLLSPVVFKITKEFFATRGESEDNPF